MADNQGLMSSLRAMGFIPSGKLWCGTWKGYAITFRPGLDSTLAMAVRAKRNDGKLVKAVKRGVKDSGIRGVSGYLCQGDAFVFTVRVGKADPEAQLSRFLDVFSQTLRECGAPPAETCAVCRESRPDSTCLIGTNQPVHRVCVQNMTHQVKEQAEDNRNNGSFATGLIGAVLGMLVGLIPSILSILFLQYIVALLFALVPLASMWGYRKFRGVQNRAATAAVVLLSLLGVLVLEFTVVVLSLVREYSAPIGKAIQYTASYVFSAEGIGPFLRDSAVSFLFMFLGIFIAWKNLRQSNDTLVQDADVALDTLRPLSSDREDDSV